MGDFGPKTWAADGSAWWTLPPTVWQSETLPTQASFLPSLLHRCQNFIIATFRGGPARQWSGKNLSQRQSAGSAAGIHTGKKEAQGENVQIPAQWPKVWFFGQEPGRKRTERLETRGSEVETYG